jgi:hypothetical protein
MSPQCACQQIYFGKVGYFKRQGEYLVAFHEKSSILNERTLIGVEEEAGGSVQEIAGVARRSWPRRAPRLGQRGQRFGMIKFGSRSTCSCRTMSRQRCAEGQGGCRQTVPARFAGRAALSMSNMVVPDEDPRRSSQASSRFSIFSAVFVPSSTRPKAISIPPRGSSSWPASSMSSTA